MVFAAESNNELLAPLICSISTSSSHYWCFHTCLQLQPHVLQSTPPPSQSNYSLLCHCDRFTSPEQYKPVSAQIDLVSLKSNLQYLLCCLFPPDFCSCSMMLSHHLPLALEPAASRRRPASSCRDADQLTRRILLLLRRRSHAGCLLCFARIHLAAAHPALIPFLTQWIGKLGVSV
jgi:hypothetical protein